MIKTKDKVKINKLKKLPPTRCNKCSKRKSYSNPLGVCFECGEKFCYDHISVSHYNPKKMNINSEMRCVCQKCKEALETGEEKREFGFKTLFSHKNEEHEEAETKWRAYVSFEDFKISLGTHADKYDDKEIERIKQKMESLADHTIDYIYRETGWGRTKEDPETKERAYRAMGMVMFRPHSYCRGFRIIQP